LEHCSKGGTAAIYQNRKVLLIKNNIVFFSESIENIPLSFGGRANFMVENILAALLAAYFQGIDVEDIRKALRSFVPSFENIPGRLNVFQLKSHRILLDSAHNAYEIISLGSWLMQEYSSYKTGIITSSGDRRDTDITNIGKASAEIFDKIIIRVDEKPKERTNKEITGLLYSGVRNCNKNLQIEIFSSEMEAILYAEKNSKPGSLIVLFTDNINNSMQVIRKLIKQEEGSSEKQFSRVWDLR
jgi:cyanophycin synthetase